MKIDKRETIMAAAKPLFATRGLDGVTTRDIAKAGGFHLGSLHHFYPQKTQLYEAVVTSAFAATTAKLIVTLGAAGTAEERFRRFVEAHLSHFASGNDDARLIDREYLDRAGRTLPDDMMLRLFTDMHGALHPVIASIAPPSRTRDDIARATAMIFSLLFGAAKLNPLHHQMLGERGSWPDPDFVDNLCSFGLAAIASEPRN